MPFDKTKELNDAIKDGLEILGHDAYQLCPNCLQSMPLFGTFPNQVMIREAYPYELIYDCPYCFSHLREKWTPGKGCSLTVEN